MDRRRGRTIPFFQEIRLHQLSAKHLSFLLLPGFAPAGSLFGPAPGEIALRKPFEGHQRKTRFESSFSAITPIVYKYITFIISGAIAAFAGALTTINLSYTNTSLISPTRNVEVIFAALMGGAGSVIGAVVGGAAFMTISNYLAVYLIRWEMFLGFALLVFVFWFRKGIWGYARKI